jgi:CubicO group peptidase (beta-lactamase class C family)
MPFVFRTLMALSLLTAAFAPGARAEPADGAPAPKTFDPKAIDAYVARQVRDKGFVGLSLAVLRDGKIVLANGYGKRCLETGAPVEVDTPFCIGSVTKQFTAACILLLAEEGKLSVEDPVAKYYPDLTRARDVTLYDLMTHASGYPDYYPLDFVDERLARPIAPDRLIHEYAGAKLDFEPGARWSYSNTGYVLLGRVVEKVSGEPLGQFLQRRILKPAGMEHTFFEPGAGDRRFAVGYTAFALGSPEVARREADGWLYAAGGLTSTAADLARWDLALMDDRILKPSSCRLMTMPRRLANGKFKEYGCGLAIGSRDGEVLLQHGGAVSGFLAYNTMVPRTRSAVILLTNGDHVDPAPLQQEILGLLLKDQAKQEGDVPRVRGPSAKEAALDFFHQMQAGSVDRSRLGADFSDYLSADRVRGSAARLKALGEPTRVEVEDLSERGGMEFARVRFTFKTGVVKAYLYRTPDGKIQEFMLFKG